MMNNPLFLQLSLLAERIDQIALAVQTRYPPQSAVAMESKIEGRIRSVLAQHRQRNRVTKALLSIGTAVTVLLLLVISAYRFSPGASANPVVSSGISGNPALPLTGIGSVPWPTPVSFPSPVLHFVEATNGKAVLPNGVTVKLLIADTQSTGPTRWWTPNGSISREPLPKCTLVFPTLPTGIEGRAFAYSANYQISAQPGEVWRSQPRFAWQYEQTQHGDGVHHIKPNFTYLLTTPALDHSLPALDHFQPISMIEGSRATKVDIIPQAVPASLSKIDLREAVAAGPWTQSITCKKTPGKVHIQTPQGELIFTLTTNPHNLKDPKAIAKSDAAFMVSDNFDLKIGSEYQTPMLDRNVFGLDSQGREVCGLRGEYFQDGYGKTLQYATISSSDLHKVSTFRFVSRPYEFVEFRDVALQPH